MIHRNPLDTTNGWRTTCDVGNTGSDMGQAYACGGVKLVNGISIITSR